MQKLVSRIRSRSCRVPRDGTRRYLYDIWQPLTLFALTTLFVVIFYPLFSPDASINPDDLFFCNADGKVEKTTEGYRLLWDPQLYFTINIAFGEYAFSTVKVIDAAWDLAVGRGGQFLAAMVAYRVIRRSLTLTMETCTVAVPTVTSLYCRQIQVASVWDLMSNISWHWGVHRTTWKQPFHSGRLRLTMQIFACVYVLAFATLASVMTGYFRYEPELTSPLLPINQVLRPGIIVYDGHRIDLPDYRMYAVDTLSELPNRSGALDLDINEFVDRSSEFEDPLGPLIDYWFTCQGLMNMISSVQRPRNASRSEPRSLACSVHRCSCSAPELLYPDRGYIRIPEMFANMTSTVALGGRLWDLPAPPLNIGLAGTIGYRARPSREPKTASDAWIGKGFFVSQSWEMLIGNFPPAGANEYPWIYNYTTYIHNDTVLKETTIKETGRCIAEDAYSWGFSSLLLLTFCSYTILFAVTLIALQHDVYWNSRHDRDHQSHSVYTDVLYLAGELTAAFGSNVNEHMQSPKRFQKEVESCKEGLLLDVQELPPSRRQARQQARRQATLERTRALEALTLPPTRAPEGGKLRTGHAVSPPHELRPFHPQDHQQLEVPTTSNPERGSSRLTPASSFTNTVDSSRRSTLAEPGLPSFATHSSAGASANEAQALIGDPTHTEPQISNDETASEERGGRPGPLG